MSDSAARAQRAAALEEKKKRLEQLKARQRERGSGKPAAAAAAASSNLDEYIDDLLKSSSAVGVAASDVGVDTGATASSVVSEGAKAVKEGGSESVVNNVIAEPARVAVEAPRRQVETFAVSTQTEEGDFAVQQTPEVQDETEAAVDEPEKEGVAASNKESSEEDLDPPKLLSADEVEKEVSSESFSTFLSTASKKVERVLGTPVLADLLVDFVGEMDGVKRPEKVSNTSRFLASRQVYECQKWTTNRDVTDVAWSHLHRELMLSTYSLPSGPGLSAPAVSAISSDVAASSTMTPRSGELQSDGLALVWNLSMPSRPEHIFTCGSPVTTGRFHPTESALVIGACQSGQLVVWDIRAGRLPVQRSSLTAIVGGSKSHTHPICSMEVIEGGSGLVTADTNGKVNFWSIGNLREPAESLQIADSLSSLTVAPESDALVFGDANGVIHAVQSSPTSQGQRSSRRAVRKLERDEETSKHHYGLVTAISAKTIPNGASSRAVGLSKGFLRGSGGLILSSGVDWSVKLWAPAYSDNPLTSWVSHSYDYMSDVQWSPTHPSLFATASSNGSLGLWNLAQSLEEPMTGSNGIQIEGESASGLNKLKWSLDGRRIVAASGNGRVHVLSLSEEVVRQKGDEDARIMSHLISRGLLERE